MYCQLETLRRCSPQDLPLYLGDLPKSLDETYERILKQIHAPQQGRAHRILQCLTVATRPLRVVELAQALTVEIPAMGGIPKMKADLRWEDQEQIVQSACSSLIALVEVDNSQLVQFSHFSVKEFLTSSRLSEPNGALQHFHIQPERANTIMAQACLGLLCNLDYNTDKECVETFPLAAYAAQHWVDHAEYGDVLSRIRDELDYFLDHDKPHLAAWLWVRKKGLHLIWQPIPEHHPEQLEAVPLYYVAVLGFRGLVQHLVSNYPEHLNSRDGRYGTPLHAAVYEKQVKVLQLLASVNVDVRDTNDQTPLHTASRLGFADIAGLLLNSSAGVNACDNARRTPLHLAAADGRLEAILMLIGHNADVAARDDEGRTPLYRAIECDHLDAAQLLLQHNADTDAQNNKSSGPLHLAAFKRDPNVTRLLLGHGANIHIRNNEGQTPLHHAVWNGNYGVMQLLLNHGADVDARDNTDSTPLHLASFCRLPKAVQLLLQHGANVHAQDREGKNAFIVASERGHQEIMQLLSEYRQSK